MPGKKYKVSLFLTQNLKIVLLKNYEKEDLIWIEGNSKSFWF
jgi:hypothetical protein